MAVKCNPPSCDYFGRHRAWHFGAGDLICKKVSLNQKSWLPNGDQAKTLTWRVKLASFCNLKWTYFAYPLFCFLWYYFNWLLDFVFIAELSVWLLASPAQSVQLLHQTCRTVHKGETSSIQNSELLQCNTYVALASMVTATLCVHLWLDVYFSKPRMYSTPHKPEVCQTWIMALCSISSDTM